MTCQSVPIHNNVLLLLKEHTDFTPYLITDKVYGLPLLVIFLVYISTGIEQCLHRLHLPLLTRTVQRRLTALQRTTVEGDLVMYATNAIQISQGTGH